MLRATINDGQTVTLRVAEQTIRVVLLESRSGRAKLGIESEREFVEVLLPKKQQDNSSPS